MLVGSSLALTSERQLPFHADSHGPHAAKHRGQPMPHDSREASVTAFFKFGSNTTYLEPVVPIFFGFGEH